MVKNLVLMALMASLAIAAPTNSLPTTTSSGFGTYSISLSTGFGPSVALAMEACSGGMVSASVSDASKAALLSWISGAGKSYFDTKTLNDIVSWCKSNDSTAITALTALNIDLVMLNDNNVSAAGGLLAYLNGIVSEALGAGCACSKISPSQQVALTAFLWSSASKLEADIAGILNLCSKGGIAETISPASKNTLTLWLSSTDNTLTADLKQAVQAWLGLAVSTVTSNGSKTSALPVPTSASPSNATSDLPNVVLTSPIQLSLGSFCAGSDFTGLDKSIQTCLLTAAHGGSAGALSGATLAKLTVYMESQSCKLDANLKSTVQAWLNGVSTTGTQSGTSKDAYAYIRTGETILSKLNLAGVLTVPSQSSLLSFISSSKGSALDTSILTPLKSCANGEAASLLTVDATSALSSWLAASSNTLPAELRGAVLLWLSSGVTGAKGVQSGVGVGAGLGLTLGPQIIAKINVLLNATASPLSSNCKGTITVAASALPASAASLAGRAELTAFLLSDKAENIGADIIAAIFGWLAGSGSACGCGN